MRQRINDIVAGIILILGFVLMIGGLLLHFCGAQIPTRIIVACGAFMVIGVFLYAQIREVDDGHLDDGF